ncbi:hypothetical protein AARAC_011498 [Aspergillus arachidicola]|uniref:Ubiquitin-like protease family profile domain-containing protein n=1 Tax=Aspergillus arachidicola TaxID=656916 RepID=A0A2G7EME0_9EURO|nr:hypothetical protein AARAC_011498 [Aspergillus arachidicola]
MAPAAQRVDLDVSRDSTNFCNNTSGDRTCPETSDDLATSRDATSHASSGPTIDPSRTSPETFGHPTTSSHRASHGAITHSQELTSEPSCDLIIQSHATSREQAVVFDAVSREPMVTPHEPAHQTSSDSLTRSLEPSHNASANDENTSCAHPITVAIAIDIIYQFSQELYEPPQHIYTEIVRSVQEDVQIQWSDDRSWRDIIEKSFFKAHRYVIFNLLEYIGASEWFDKQVSIAQESFLTKKHQPIKRSTAAGKVLDNIWERCNPRLNNVSSKLQKAQRQRIWLQLHRGRELRSRLAKRLGLGILFSPIIWDLLKLPCDKLDSTINLILADPELMTLLQLLSKQLEYLVNTGSTDLQTFCNGLKEHHLVPEQEIEDLLVTLRTDKGSNAQTQIENIENLHDSSQVGLASSDHVVASQRQIPQAIEPDFKAFKDNDNSSIIGFEFENVNIISEDISDVNQNLRTMQENTAAAKENIPHVSRKIHWLTISHIRLFCLYLRLNLSRRDRSGEIYFFCPLTVNALEEGWEFILDSEGPQSDKNYIFAAHYLVFPVVTDENDHWFTVIVSSPGGLANGETPTVYILDSSWFDWKKEKLYQPIKRVITRAMGSLNATQRGMIRFYEATEGTLPQQSNQLCGYYLMLYLELLAADPDALLTRVRDFNTAKTRMDYLFEPGKMDGELAERFAELIKEFQHAEQKQGRLITESGRPMFDGDLGYLARGVSLA